MAFGNHSAIGGKFYLIDTPCNDLVAFVQTGQYSHILAIGISDCNFLLFIPFFVQTQIDEIEPLFLG